jgi:hypothetical protein
MAALFNTIAPTIKSLHDNQLKQQMCVKAAAAAAAAAGAGAGQCAHCCCCYCASWWSCPGSQAACWLAAVCTHQLQDVLVIQAAVDADLPVHLVVVELRQLAAVIHLDGDLGACCLADGQVHSGRIATSQLLGNNKLVNAPAK